MDLDARTEAMTETQRLVERFRSAAAPRASKADQHSRQALALVKALATERRETGDLLTQLMRLPFTYQPVALSIAQSEEPYKHEGADLYVRLRNASPDPLTIIVGLDWIPDPKHANDAWVDGSTGHGVERWKTLTPGEEIEMRAHWAALALSAHSLTAHQPAYWGSSSAIPERDDLVEVGYRCPGWGDEFTSRPTKPRRNEKAA